MNSFLTISYRISIRAATSPPPSNVSNPEDGICQNIGKHPVQLVLMCKLELATRSRNKLTQLLQVVLEFVMHMRFGIFTVVNVKIIAFWDMTPQSDRWVVLPSIRLHKITSWKTITLNIMLVLILTACPPPWPASRLRRPRF
jgi:hypothetical protein